MGLLIYRSPDPGSVFSVDGSFDDPLVNAFDGARGGVLVRRYYIRNDDSLRSYSSILVQPVHNSGDNIVDGSNGFSWKLFAGDTQPLEAQWDLVSAGSSISIPDIGTPTVSDTTTYEPFWLRIEVPRGAPVKSYSGITLDISGTEELI